MDRNFLCTHSTSALTTLFLRCVLKLLTHVTSYMKMLMFCVSQNNLREIDFDRHICTQGQTGKADASSLVTRAPCSIPATLHACTLELWHLQLLQWQSTNRQKSTLMNILPQLFQARLESFTRSSNHSATYTSASELFGCNYLCIRKLTKRLKTMASDHSQAI